MKIGAMTHMDEIGLLCSYTFCKGYSFADALVRGVRLDAQGIDHESRYACEFVHLRRWHFSHISDISQLSYSEADHRKPTMHHANGDDLCITNCETLIRIDLVHSKVWRTRIGMLSEAIEEVALYGSCHILLGTYLYGLQHREGTQIVKSAHMVVMLVSDEHGIDGRKGVVVVARGEIACCASLLRTALYTGAMKIGQVRSSTGTLRMIGEEPQHLLSEVGSAVDENKSGSTCFRVCIGLD